MGYIVSLLISALFILAPSDWAQSQSNSIAPQDQQDKGSRSFGVALSLQKFQSLNEELQAPGRRIDTTHLLVRPSGEFEYFQIGAQVGFQIDHLREENSGFGDLLFEVNGYPWIRGRYFRISPISNWIAPVSKDSRVRESLLGSGALGVRWDWIAFRYLENKYDFIVNSELLFQKNIHKYEEATDGSINASWSPQARLGINTQLSRVRISIDGGYTALRSYQQRNREILSHNESIGILITNNFLIQVGHRLTSPVFKPNGIDTNFTLTDSQRSLFTAGLIWNH